MSGQAGMTLVELMVAAFVLVVGVLGTLTLLDNANQATARTKAREAATNLAREVVEASRSIPYPNLSPAVFADELRSQPGLADANAEAGWNVRRRNILYTVTADVCTVDDNTVAKDGLGLHTGETTTYCDGQPELAAGQPATDSNPDDYKRVKVTIAWTKSGQERRVVQEAVINNPGSAFAPAVKTLTHTPATATASTSNLAFTATTTSRPNKLLWSVDGIEQGQATGSQTTWTFSWTINGVEDGTYLVSAQAFDEFGESGASKTETILLNRFPPDPPAPPAGGYNGSFGVELEWAPNPERDIVGYRVYRVAALVPSALDVKVCETSVEDALPTSCRDTTAIPGATYHYYVVAVAPAHIGVGLEESARPTGVGDGKTLKVEPGNAAPSPPADLTAVRSEDGVTLTWTAGSDADGVRYYRIYRDGKAFADRLDRTPSGGVLTFLDGDPGLTPRTYWVTAVDNKLAESTPAPADGVTG
jgi:Tfp pilus assembly protein PilV